MRGRLLPILLVVLAAVLLHLPAHFAPSAESRLREALPEDGPVLTRNEALARREGEGLGATTWRAMHDPGAAWDGAADTVGASRWRPAATALAVAEYAAPDTEDGVARVAALVSLVLHVLVSLAAMRLVAALGGDARASLFAGLLAAASPAALAAAAWPARQAVVLATALAAGGALLALRGGAVRLVAAGCVLAVAGLAHEAAFGWVLAVPLLVHAASRGRTQFAAAWPCAIAPALALWARHSMLSHFAAASAGPTDPAAADALRGPHVLDGAAGILATAVGFFLPARAHFADGPFVCTFLAHAAAIVALVAGGTWLARRASQPAAATALAALAALVPLLGIGATGGAPFQDSYLYLVLPLAAAAAGLAFAGFAARRDALRLPAVAAAALLLGASVATTAARAPSFRTKSGLVALAKAEMPASLVVRAWDASERLGSGPGQLAACAPDVATLAADATGRNLARTRGDAVASATLSRLFTSYAAAMRTSPLPLTDAAYDAADTAGAAAAQLRPGSARMWAVLAALRIRTGNFRGAIHAAGKSMSLAPSDAGIVAQGVEVALTVGNSRFAADTMERAVESLRADPSGPPLTPEFLMLYARALAADGALRVPDPSSDKGLRHRYDLAADVLVAVRDLPSQRSPSSPAAQLLYDVYVRYGDLLASTDRPAMALLSYQRAVEIGTHDPQRALQIGPNDPRRADLHGIWLQQRLQAEEAKANKRLAEAMKDKPDDIGNALLELYVSFCRQAKWADADEVFAKLEAAVGGVPPELRLQRAVHRFAALEDAKNQASAETELRRVIREKPDLHRAKYELARVLEWQGTLERFTEARDLYEAAARDGVREDWALEADARAQVMAEVIRTTPR